MEEPIISAERSMVDSLQECDAGPRRTLKSIAGGKRNLVPTITGVVLTTTSSTRLQYFRRIALFNYMELLRVHLRSG